jgi:bacillopeptidase F
VKRPIIAAVLALAAGLSLGRSAGAGTVEPALQARVLTAGAGASVPVIVQFADRLDLQTLRQAVARTLAQRYPDPHDRRAARPALKRAMLVEGLRQRAGRGEGLVRSFLASRGQRGELKSLWLINGVAARVPAALVDALAELPGVERVSLDAEVQGPGTGSPPAGPTNWNLDLTGAPSLWQQGHTGGGVVVATLDSGVDAAHPDLGPRWRGGAHDWFDPYGQHATPADATGHGTRVLGLILAGDLSYYQVGMAPDARWIAAKIFDDTNTATLSAIHQAYQWVLDPDGDPLTDDAPDIVNNSWDLAGTDGQCVQEFAPDIALLKAAEIAVVFAGGNYGDQPNTSVSPANDPAVLAVGSIDYLTVVDFQSSRGVNACDGGVYPHLVAPGVSVWTTVRVADAPYYPYDYASGTSFAVAHVAGAMALLKGAFPAATVSQLEMALRESAVDLGAVGPDSDYGYGLVNLEGAYAWLEGQLGGGSPGALALGAVAYAVDEDVASLTVTVTRSGGSAGAVSVDYATADGLATAGEDYQAAAGTLTFADGETSRTLELTLLNDRAFEGDEDFTVTLSNAQGGATLGLPASAPVTIRDDELLYFSLVGITNPPGIVGGPDDADIYAWDGTSFTRVVDATALGVPDGANVDGLVVVDPRHFYVSFTGNLTLRNRDDSLVTVQDEDIVYYNDDAGAWSVYFDATAAGLTAVQQDIDAFDIVDGVVYFSMWGNTSPPGVINPPGMSGFPPDDADIFAWDPGSSTFTRVVDASARGVPANIKNVNANVDGLSYVDALHFYVSFRGEVTLTNSDGSTITVQDEDVVYYSDGVWSVYLDGTATGLTSPQRDIDALSVASP